MTAGGLEVDHGTGDWYHLYEVDDTGDQFKLSELFIQVNTLVSVYRTVH
jgi:hypothetical protein